MRMSSDEVCEVAKSLEFAGICVGDVVRRRKSRESLVEAGGAKMSKWALGFGGRQEAGRAS